MKRLIILLVVHTLTYIGGATAYERETHKELSKKAVDASALNPDSTVLSNLGLKSPDDPTQKFQNSEGTKRTIKELVEDGSAFEDNGIRARNHFYDPLHNRPLTLGAIALGESSPDWALEDTKDSDKQTFSFKHARLYFQGALTEASKQDRDRLFGLTFQTLGQIIHHLQDMAQPQHVRNDRHLDLFGEFIDLPLVESPSLYERYTEGKNVCATPSLCSSYGSVKFTTARDFWVTADGRGIAQFTNYNFVSAGTNFTGSLEHFEPYPDFPFPNGDGATIEVREVGDPELGNLDLPVDGPFLDLDSRPLDGKLYFIGTPVTDTYYNVTEFNNRTSTFSLYDQYLEQYRVEICGTAGNPCARARATFTLNQVKNLAASCEASGPPN